MYRQPRILTCALKPPGHEVVARWLRIQTSLDVGSWTDDRAVEWIKTCLEECVDTHNHAPLAEGFCPDRLLDVSRNPARLILKSDIAGSRAGESISSAPPYSALSYCWGSEIEAKYQLKTTTTTLPARLSGIDFDEMPPVLQDAVSLTRRLSIPYLWIDALCILQDPGDTRDWERQSSVMHKIYGNSLITLAAIASSSC